MRQDYGSHQEKKVNLDFWEQVYSKFYQWRSIQELIYFLFKK